VGDRALQNDDITAVVVAYNSAAALPACLAAIAAAGLAAVVVDNASTDRSRDIAADGSARVIANPRNEGFGRAANRGVAAATTPYCLALNPDITFAPDAIQRLRRALVENPKAALAGPRLLGSDGRDAQLTASPINRAGELLSGAAMLVRRDVFLTLGGFDPNIFLFWEDNDLCRRAVDEGYHVVVVHDAHVHHVRGGSTAPTPGHIYRIRWHQAWSRFYVLDKHRVPSDLGRWLLRFRIKAAGAQLLGNANRLERYRGSCDGARAFQLGQTALAKEDLV